VWSSVCSMRRGDSKQVLLVIATEK
jgi:hypothetical protein